MYLSDCNPTPAPAASIASLPERSVCDVIVIGGGPAGSTVATRLAERGWRVTLFEKDRHPRFHIGESLLPMSLPLFEQLGVLDQVERIGVRKYAAEFCSAEHGRTMAFEFARAIDPSHPYAYHVQRAEFDELLLRNSERKGVLVKEGWRAESADLDDPGRCSVSVTDPGGARHRWEARFLIDASGRDTFLSNRLELKCRNRRHNSAAMFAHFRGVRRHSGQAAGNISIYWFEHGWIWMIPLPSDIMSVGAVCWPYYLKSRRQHLPEFFAATLAMSAEVQSRLGGAERINEVSATGNYSYNSRAIFGRNHLLVGDAFTFIDPVFSTGVHLAMTSAFIGADAVDAALRDPRRAVAEFRRYERRVRRGLKTFSWFIYRITTPAMRDLIMYPRNILGVEQAIISLLAGDLFGRTRLGARLLLFRLFYYITVLGAPRRNFAAYRRRRRNIRTE